MTITSWLRNLRSISAGGRAESSRRRARPRRAATHCRPRLEAFEDRSLPSTFTVLNLADSGPGSLRQAVSDANAHPGADAIGFAHGLKGTIT